MNGPGAGGREGRSYRSSWNICLWHLKALQGSGVIRSNPDRETEEFHPEGWEEPWAGPGMDRSVSHRIHTSDVTVLMSPLQLSKEEFNPKFCQKRPFAQFSLPNLSHTRRAAGVTNCFICDCLKAWDVWVLKYQIPDLGRKFPKKCPVPRQLMGIAECI